MYLKYGDLDVLADKRPDLVNERIPRMHRHNQRVSGMAGARWPAQLEVAILCFLLGRCEASGDVQASSRRALRHTEQRQAQQGSTGHVALLQWCLALANSYTAPGR